MAATNITAVGAGDLCYVLTRMKGTTTSLLLGTLAFAAGCKAAPLGGPDGCYGVQGSCKSSTGCIDYSGYSSSDLVSLEAGCNETPAVWSSTACDAHGSEGGCEIVLGEVCIVAWAFSPTVEKTAEGACLTGAEGNVWLSPPAP
ncbi:MAG TPA: hypothetical protein VH560_17205 [Polyangia bacterium]|jgi:hypothetical protein|nr:hypothetical protein [Polyangia bacterium]